MAIIFLRIRPKNENKELQKNKEILSYTEDLFWNAIIKWKWKKDEDNLSKIDINSIKKVCPNCRQELEPRKQGEYYFLFCDSCKFISSQFYEGKNPSNSSPESIFKKELISIINNRLKNE